MNKVNSLMILAGMFAGSIKAGEKVIRENSQGSGDTQVSTREVHKSQYAKGVEAVKKAAEAAQAAADFLNAPGQTEMNGDVEVTPTNKSSSKGLCSCLAFSPKKGEIKEEEKKEENTEDPTTTIHKEAGTQEAEVTENQTQEEIKKDILGDGDPLVGDAADSAPLPSTEDKPDTQETPAQPEVEAPAVDVVPTE